MVRRKRRKRRKASLAARFGLLIGGTVVGLVLVEVVARVAFAPAIGHTFGPYKPGDDCFLADPDVGYVLRPLVCGHNSLGFAGPELSEKSEDVTRVAILGDSIVIQSFFVDILDRVLPARLDRPMEFVNMGVSGYTTEEEAALLRKWGQTVQPDLVIVAFCVNDYSMTPLYVEIDGKMREVRKDLIPMVSLSPFLFRHSAMYRLWAERRISKANQAQPGDRVSETHAALDDLVVQTQDLGAELLVVVFPYLMYRDQYPPREAKAYTTVMDALASRGIATVDLAPAFEAVDPDLLRVTRHDEAVERAPSVLEGRPDRQLLLAAIDEILVGFYNPNTLEYDYIHPNILGHTLAAAEIMDFVSSDPATRLGDPQTPPK